MASYHDMESRLLREDGLGAFLEFLPSAEAPEPGPPPRSPHAPPTPSAEELRQELEQLRPKRSRSRGGLTVRERRVLLRVDRAPYHVLPLGKLGVPPTVVRTLEDRGLLRVLPERGCWPRRYVVTISGHYALDTFAHIDDDL